MADLIKRKKERINSTYPSPKSQFCPKWEVGVNVDLGVGYVVSLPETTIDPQEL